MANVTTIPPHDLRHLNTSLIGKRVWCFPSLDSTNTLALSLANDAANDGLVLLAEQQTTGRGQYGRTWTAPPGSSVLLSVLLFPPPFLRPPALLTAWAAVAVCETIGEVAELQATIKWPNDVLVHGQKVCGILIEQRNTGLADCPFAAAVGIGLNVRQDAAFFKRAELPLAGSLATLSGASYDTRTVAERLIGRLDASYQLLLSGESETLESLWKERLGVVGRQVTVELTRETRKGRLLEVAWDGLVLEETSGTVRIGPEMVRHIIVTQRDG
jgi:BirA family biotin operon repressor/biotin-[acetyl-CoA-carboxylase] ligase